MRAEGGVDARVALLAHRRVVARVDSLFTGRLRLLLAVGADAHDFVKLVVVLLVIVGRLVDTLRRWRRRPKQRRRRARVQIKRRRERRQCWRQVDAKRGHVSGAEGGRELV